MPIGKARLKTYLHAAIRAVCSCGLAAFVVLFGARVLQNAVAEGDTRTISLHHIHTDENISITFKRDGRYDEAALEKLNWFLRDWRRQQQTRMDPHLIDLLWEVHRESGSQEPIWVVCGYRSPETNAMLRRRSQGVARFSQHMLGHAMDFYIPGVPLEQLRVIGLRLQRGGVGFYPTSGSPFVHMDTGGIRHWPRMTREQLVRVFPDGRTVHIPTDGRPLPGYALALADIRRRGGTPSDMSVDAARTAGVDVAGLESHRVNPLAKFLGLARDDEDDESATASSASAPAAEPLRARAKAAVAAAITRAEDKIARAEDKIAAEKAKLIKIASKAHVITRAEAAPSSANDGVGRIAPTPNEVIASRGYWQGLPDGMTAARPTATTAVARPRHAEVASADAEATGAVGPFLPAPDDRVPADLALAYAEQPPQGGAQGAALYVPGAEANRAASRAAAVPPGENQMTVAVKRVGNRPASTIFTVTNKKSPSFERAAPVNDPWMRAVVLSPSVHRFLNTLALGNRDFTLLATMMVKPSNAVMMTFSSDPNPGLDHDRFSGSAISFMSTVTYSALTNPAQTADLL